MNPSSGGEQLQAATQALLRMSDDVDVATFAARAPAFTSDYDGDEPSPSEADDAVIVQGLTAFATGQQPGIAPVVSAPARPDAKLAHRKIDPGKKGFAPSAPAGPRLELHGDYKAERADPKHRMGKVLKLVFDMVYVPQFKATQMGADFFDWLNTISYFDMRTVLRRAYIADQMEKSNRLGKKIEIRGEDAEDFVKRNATAFVTGVKYLSAAEAKKYKVRLRDGVLALNGQPLDTGAMQTVFSGMGWGIWVMSRPMGNKKNHRFFTASHRLGLFHHSSFLSGNAVSAAGEWQVSKGKLQYISGKTGHYLCDTAELVLAIKTLQSRGIALDEAKVITFARYTAALTLTPALDFLQSDHDARDNNLSGSAVVGQKKAPQPRMATLGAHRRR